MRLADTWLRCTRLSPLRRLTRMPTRLRRTTLPRTRLSDEPQRLDPVALVALDQVPADGVPVGPLVEDDAVVAVGEGAVPAHHPVGHVLGEHDPMGAVAVRLVALHHQPPAAGVRVEPVELVVAEDVAPEHQALGLVGVGAEEVVVEHRVGGPAGGAAPVHPVGRGPVGPEVGEGRADDPEVGPVGVLDDGRLPEFPAGRRRSGFQEVTVTPVNRAVAPMALR